MSELDPRTDPLGYAYAFTNEYAPAYAREAIEAGDVTDVDSAEDWAHETADSLAAVIYTGQAIALYGTGLFTMEDDDLAATALGACWMEDGREVPTMPLSVGERIDRAIVALSYAWHRRVLSDAIHRALADPLSSGISLA